VRLPEAGSWSSGSRRACRREPASCLGAAAAAGLRVLALVTGYRLPPWSSGDVAK